MTIRVTSGRGGTQRYFSPEDGMYIMEFVGREETTKRAWQSEEEEPAWRFKYRLFDFSTKAEIIDPESGEPAVYQDRVKQSLNTRSNAYTRLTALLRREPADGETDDALFAEAEGKRCFGTFAGGWLKTSVRMPEGM